MIGVARVVDSSSFKSPQTGFIYTNYRLNFTEVWKGESSPGFLLTKPGGTVGTKKGTIPGHEYELNPGEEVVVFATPSTIGNHVPIGIHQGLYRVSREAGSPVYPVSEYRTGPGTGSTFTLQALKAEVYQALGKPVEFRPAPAAPSGSETPREAAAKADPGPEGPAPAAAPAVPRESEGAPRWIGMAAVGVLLGAVAVLALRRRISRPHG